MLLFLAPRKNVANDLRCAMNGQEIMEKNKMTIKHKNARKKRDGGKGRAAPGGLARANAGR